MELQHRDHYIPLVPLFGMGIALLSATPFLSCVNCCFFAWVVGGAAVVVKLVGNRVGDVVSGGEGVFIGGLTGFVSGFITVCLWLVFQQLLGLGTVFEILGIGEGQGKVSEVSRQPWVTLLGSFCLSMFGHPVFGALGGLLGSYLTAKDRDSEAPLAPTYTTPSERLDDRNV